MLNVEESMCDKTIRCQFLSLSHGTDVKGKGTWGTGEMLELSAGCGMADEPQRGAGAALSRRPCERRDLGFIHDQGKQHRF